jgi:hypothetical protein
MFIKRLVGNPEEGLLWRAGHRWENNIMTCLKKKLKRCGLDSAGSEYGPVAIARNHDKVISRPV